MSFLVRSVHVASVSYLLGGSVLLLMLIFAAHHNGAFSSRTLLEVMRLYEWGFWAAFGAIAMTGIGNLGAFGTDLPGTGSAWGREFGVKLVLVVALFLLALVRTMSLVMVSTNRDAARGIGILAGMYGATAVLAASVLAAAVALAHY